MELIKSSNTIAKAVPKIVETPLHFSINSQLYDKLTFKPLPMKFLTRDIGNFLSLHSSIDRIVNTVKVIMTEQLHNTEHNQANIIQDKYDPNIFYALRLNTADLMENHIFEKVQYKPDTKEYSVVNSLDIGAVFAGRVRNQVKILYENDENFVMALTGRGQSGSVYGLGILVVNKNSFGVNVITNETDQTCYYLTGTNDEIYILRMAASTYYINKFNINTKAYTQIYQYPYDLIANVTAKRTTCNPVMIDNNLYMLYTHNKDTAYYYKIMKTSIDINTDTVTTESFDIDLNGFVLDDTGALNFGSSLYHTLRVIESNGNKYLSVLIHCSTNNTATDVIKHCKHVLIKMEDNKFTVVDVIKFTDGCLGSLEYNDSAHQVFFNPNSILFYAFNSTEEKMELTYRKSGVYTQIGFDSLNRFVTQSIDNSIEITTEGNASILKADFNQDMYDKNQYNDIEGTVRFYAKNFLDKYVDTNVKLTLIGPVVFKENKTNELVVSSSNQGIKEVPVIITGYGNIEVIITQNT